MSAIIHACLQEVLSIVKNTNYMYIQWCEIVHLDFQTNTTRAEIVPGNSSRGQLSSILLLAVCKPRKGWGGGELGNFCSIFGGVGVKPLVSTDLCLHCLSDYKLVMASQWMVTDCDPSPKHTKYTGVTTPLTQLNVAGKMCIGRCIHIWQVSKHVSWRLWPEYSIMHGRT